MSAAVLSLKEQNRCWRPHGLAIFERYRKFIQLFATGNFTQYAQKHCIVHSVMSPVDDRAIMRRIFISAIVLIGVAALLMLVVSVIV